MAQSAQNKTQNQQYLNSISPNFIGRRNEIKFFIDSFLQPDLPLYRIMSISGTPGIGKTYLLRELLKLTQKIPVFKDKCLTAFIDEHQSGPTDIMKAVADQLSNAGHRLKHFEPEWASYQQGYQNEQAAREAARKDVADKVASLVGTTVEEAANLASTTHGLPPGTGTIIKPFAENATSFAWSFFTKKFEEREKQQEINQIYSPLVALTKVFIRDLADISQPSTTFLHYEQKTYKIFLFFDTFSRLASTTAPWLLDTLLPNLANNVALFIASRDPLASYIPDGYRQWQPYLDTNIPNYFPLQNFSQDETTAYLKLRNITDTAKIQSFWTATQGNPYYLLLITAHPSDDSIDPLGLVVANFLSTIPQGQENELMRRLALEASLFAKTFNRDELTTLPIMQGRDDISDLYAWILAQPFIRQYRYSEPAQTLFSLFLRDDSPDEYNKTRKALIENYQQQLQQRIGIDAYTSQDWLPLSLALVTELLLQTPDEEYRCDAIELILKAYVHTNETQKSDISRTLRHLSRTENNPADERSRIIAEKLLICIQADVDSQEFIDANSYLLERAAQQPTFPHEILAIIYRQRGQAFAALQNYKQSIEDLSTSITMNNQDALEYGSRGFAYRLSGQFELANNDFTDALTLNPSYLWAYKQRALTHRSLGQFDKAIDDLNTYISHYNQSSWAYGQRGKIYRLLKNYSQALQDLNKAIELNQQNSWAYAQRGMVYLWQKDLTLAKLDYLHCQEIDSKNINYLSLVVWIDMLQQRDDATAIQQLETQLPPDAPAYSILVGQGMAAWLHKDFAQAQTKLQQAIDQEPHRWNARFWNAMTLLSTNQDEKAIEELTQTLQLGMPPILLTPLQWFQQNQTEFYAKTLAPIIQRSGG